MMTNLRCSMYDHSDVTNRRKQKTETGRNFKWTKYVLNILHAQ